MAIEKEKRSPEAMAMVKEGLAMAIGKEKQGLAMATKKLRLWR